MRKLSFGLLAVAMAAVVFTSCKKEENAAPVVSFTNIADSISTLEVTADNYDLTIQVTSEAGLKEVKISETKNGTTTDKETITTFENGADFTKVYKVSGIPTAGMDVTISATDKDDQNTTRKISLKKKEVVPVGEAINTYTAKLLGSNNNTTEGSYLSTSTGTIYFSKDKITQKAVIDIIYGTEGSTDEFFSPAIALSGITGGNATKYATSTIDFAAVNDDLLLQNIAATNDKLSGFQVGDVIQFVTSAGKKGIFKVTAYTAGIAGSVTIDVKVQK